MRKIAWLIIVLGILSASAEAFGQTQCDAWKTDFDTRAVAFTSQCIRSRLLVSGNDYCRRENLALESQRSRVLHECPRSR